MKAILAKNVNSAELVQRIIIVMIVALGESKSEIKQVNSCDAENCDIDFTIERAAGMRWCFQ